MAAPFLTLLTDIVAIKYNRFWKSRVRTIRDFYELIVNYLWLLGEEAVELHPWLCLAQQL